MRAQELGLHYAFQGVHDKLRVVDELLAELQLPYAALLYMGDDLVDLPVLRRAGLAVSVPTGVALARELAHYVTQAPAGEGAVREVCEWVLTAQGNLDAALAPYMV
jgi:3-deoxy-D-manno-octulosonate 8-phosphate phosphatase (KDO 8-P phosphatase)